MMHLFKLTAIGLLAFGTSANVEPEEQQGVITMEEITEMMRQEHGDGILQGEGGLRKLQCQPWSCEQGSNPKLVMTFAGRKWGSCVDMDPCLCGLMPLQMAYWCPKECRVDCGGTCATEAACPDGFAIENGEPVILEYPLPPPPWEQWPCGLGTACPTPAPTPAPSRELSASPAPSISAEPTMSAAPTEMTRADEDLPPIWNLGK